MGAILLPLAVIGQAHALIANGQISGLWIAITVACLVFMGRGARMWKAAKLEAARPPARPAPPADIYGSSYFG